MTPTSALAGWRAELAASRRSPWLASLVLRHAAAVARRAAAIHARLAALPRRTRRRLARQWAMALPVAALALAWSGGGAEAATIHVGGGCTLVDAIHAANHDRAVGGCGGGSGSDTVVLRGRTYSYSSLPRGTGRYGALLGVTSPVVIEGRGATLARTPDAEDRFSFVNVSASGDLGLRDLTLRGSYSVGGASVLNRGKAEILRTTITSGRGHAIKNEGEMTIVGSRALDHVHGSGVYNTQGASVTIARSEIARNGREGPKGGVVSLGYTWIESTRIEANQRSGGGGGIHVWGEGSLILRSSIVHGNRNLGIHGGGGIFLGAGRATIVDTTVSGNSTDVEAGGGLYARADTSVEVLGSTFEGNSAPYGGGLASQADLHIEGSTVRGNSAAGSGGGLYQSDGALSISGSRIEDNAALWGGGVASTDAERVEIVDTSLERNRAAERGGGVEARSVTLRRAILRENEAAQGGGIAAWSDLRCEACRIEGNVAEVGGGVFAGDASTFIEGSWIADNTAAVQGGGLFDASGRTTIFESELVENQGGDAGGGVYSGGDLDLIGSRLSGNEATRSGGAIHMQEARSDLRVSASLIDGNRAGRGAGIRMYGGDAELSNVTIAGNVAETEGGGLHVESASGGTLTHVSLVGNEAPEGAALAARRPPPAEETEPLIWLQASLIARSVGDDCGIDAPIGGAGNLIDDHAAGACADLADAAVTGLAAAMASQGGPTLTYALLPDSNAIDGAPDCLDAHGDPVTTDQRGTARPQDGDGDGKAACDIGAYELAVLGPPIFLPALHKE